MTGKVGARDPALVNDAPAGHRPSGFDPARLAFTSLGEPISATQAAAALDAMRGDFAMMKIAGALCRSGVTGEGYVAERAADRLLQKARKEGLIVAVNNRNWRAVNEHTLAAIAMEARQGGDACGSVHDSAAIAQGEPQ